MTLNNHKAIVLAISGCSSSGKTTLSRLLRDIFPKTFILHEDDFYRPENELTEKAGFLDWDCPESLDIPAIAKALKHIQETGQFPPDLDSKEDKNDVQQVPVADEVIADLKARVAEWTKPGNPGHKLFSESSDLRFCLFDGFLLFSPSMDIVQPYMDIRIFLRASYDKAVRRREARSGYVTLEGFWEDPPGYVEKVVWPNYVDSHQWMFENGDVEGKFKDDVLQEWKIDVIKEHVDIDMESTLKWAVETIIGHLERLAS